MKKENEIFDKLLEELMALEKQFPELISIDNSKIKMVNYIEMIPLFIHKIKQMEREIEYLKNI